MRNRLLILFFVLFSGIHSQGFYFERVSQLDTCYITTGTSYSEGLPFEESHYLTKTSDDHLILTYGHTYCNFPGNFFNYVKVDTIGNVIWQKSGSGYSLKELKHGHLIGFNINSYDYSNVDYTLPINYYDSQLNRKWKKAYLPNKDYYINILQRFNFLDTLNQSNFFKYYYTYPALPDSNKLFITGNIDSLGGLSNIMNEPIIYNSDSVNSDFNSFNVQTKCLGNYNNKTYFLNSGNKTGSWSWWSNKKVYSYAYISTFDSVSNKYKYYDIKIDSLTYIGGFIRFSDDRVWVYGSKQFQPYVFCVRLNGQVNWAKKVNLPDLSSGNYGNFGFNDAIIVDQNKILLGKGGVGSGISFSEEYLYVDSLFQITEKIYGLSYTPNSLRKINKAVYTYEWPCKKIGIIKTKTLVDIPCWATNTLSIDIQNTPKPKLNYLELQPLSFVSLTVTSLITATFQPNTDTLIKINGCIPTCYIPPSPPNTNINPNIIIYPNPSSKLVNINLIGKYDLKIYNASGKKLKELEGVSFKQIDISPYPTGMYFFVIGHNGETHKVKVIKKE